CGRVGGAHLPGPGRSAAAAAEQRVAGGRRLGRVRVGGARLLLVAPLAVGSRRAALCAAWAVSVGLGLAFVFVKAPHPWGWEGFDEYRALGLLLARGGMFSTLEVPWGYPAFLALFYRAFGDRQWIPLVAQVLLNGTVPLMLS